MPYSPAWPSLFDALETTLQTALDGVPVLTIEHVGSTAVPGLVAKPVIDIDVVVDSIDVGATVTTLEAVGYRHLGDLGLPGREALASPDDHPLRHVYVCADGGLPLRNHLVVRDVLRGDETLRQRYGALKTKLAADPGITVADYTRRKSAMLQQILRAGGLTDDELARILDVNA